MKGLSKYSKILTNDSYSGIWPSAPVIKLIPRNNAPKPKITAAIFLSNGFFPNINTAEPINIINGATAVSFNDTNCEVIVVPIFAPKVNPTDLSSVKMPAFTKLTSITVVAPED